MWVTSHPRRLVGRPCHEVAADSLDRIARRLSQDRGSADGSCAVMGDARLARAEPSGYGRCHRDPSSR